MTEYEKGFRDAQLKILFNYCKEHEIILWSEVQELSNLIGLSEDEINDFTKELNRKKESK